MKASEVKKKLIKGIPRRCTWRMEEPYGSNEFFDKNAEIEKILYTVTPTEEVVKYFIENNFDLLISHHPFEVDVPQLIFHTALDCCKGGLNDMWRDELELKEFRHFDQNLGWYGQINPISFIDLTRKIEVFIGGKILGQKESQVETIQSVVLCTGLGGIVYDEALKTGADCYIFGENLIRREPMGFKAIIEVGHTLSERMGIRKIREILGKDVQIELAPLEFDVFGKEVA